MDCVAQSGRGVRRATTVAGAEPGGRPVVVPTLIAANVAVFVLTVAQAGSIGGNAAAPLFGSWSLVPALVGAGEWWRVLTAGFLHFGPLHLAFNMFALWIIGREVEQVLGRGRFVAVYLIALLGGSTLVMLFSLPGLTAAPFLGAPAGIPVAGASGAVFGIMGALVVIVRRLRVPAGQLYMLLAINLAIGFLPGISLTGHLGGLVMGAAATVALIYAPPGNRARVQVGILSALAVALLAVLAATVLI